MAKSKSPKPTASSDDIPDWSYWGNLATTNLRSALQLSLGLDPNRHTPALEPNMEIRVQYWNRLAVAKNHAPGADWVVGRVVREDGDISVEFTEVYLKKFAAWIINETTLRPLPDEFVSLFEKQAQVAQATLTHEPQSSSATPTSSPDPRSLPNSTTLTNHTPLLQPVHLNLNRETESAYYFAKQPLPVLNDFMRVHRDSPTKAAKTLGIDRRVLGKVLKNVRAGRKPWADS